MTRLFVDQLTSIDFAYFSTEKTFVGESLIVDLSLEGDYNDESMIVEFGELKSQVKTFVDDHFDHRFWTQENLLSDLDLDYFEFKPDDSSNLSYTATKSAFLCLPFTYQETTSESLQQTSLFLSEEIQKCMPSNVSKASVSVRTELNDGGYYHYCHGLRFHKGNCQRLVHGHRSNLKVFLNGERELELERKVRQHVNQIFFVSSMDQLSSSQNEMTTVRYEGTQGVFSLTYPSSKVRVLATDTTVECISKYLYDFLMDSVDTLDRDRDRLSVHAYEGISKGAIAEG
tara:strand:- start:1156 stop:2013 length:858 start_codon:yes stop_codon:yes gene_type:complete